MEYYDVIIIGAGIAGCGLAYNLKRIGYKGSVLVIDKEGVGANAAYGYRNTTKEIIKEYNFPYIKKFKGVKVGAYDDILMTVNKDYYFFDYTKICSSLLKKSGASFHKEIAISTNHKKIITSNKKYSFKYLIDCSGANFFLKKRFKQQLPFRYWIGKVRKLKNKSSELDKDYFYFLFDDEGFLEEIYNLNTGILHGYWQYTKKINFNLIHAPENTLLKKYVSNLNIDCEYKVIGPCTPAFPLAFKNYAFLGDSFGNATTSSASGILPGLDSSKILADAIDKNNLRYYQKEWKKRYIPSYLPYLISRLDRFNNPIFIKKIKQYPKNSKVAKILSNYPEVFVNILENKTSIVFPEEIKKMFPKRQKLWQLYYYLYLKLRGL